MTDIEHIRTILAMVMPDPKATSITIDNGPRNALLAAMPALLDELERLRAEIATAREESGPARSRLWRELRAENATLRAMLEGERAQNEVDRQRGAK